MNKLCISCLGALLLAVYLSSQVQAQGGGENEAVTTTNTPNMTVSMATTTYDMTTYNMTTNGTDPKNGCGRTEAWTLLLPLTVAASLLHIGS